jgi:hypothetical protein
MNISNIQPLELESEQTNQLLPQVNHLDTTPHSAELNRLFVAAVVSPRFCQLLLSSPLIALTVGYRGQPFKLTSAERNRLLTVHATSLQDFAHQLGVAERPEPYQRLLRPRSRNVRLTIAPLQHEAE